jgi:hypothetical protein
MLQQRLQSLSSIPAFSGSILQCSWLEIESSKTRRNCRQPEGREAGAYAARWLAGWLVGWVPLRFPACRACFFFQTERRERERERERECVCFSSGERRGSYFANPQIFSSLLCAIAFLSSSSPCHSLLLSCCGRVSLSCRARTYSTFLRRCLCSVVCFLSLCVCASALEIQETTDSLSDP